MKTIVRYTHKTNKTVMGLLLALFVNNHIEVLTICTGPRFTLIDGDNRFDTTNNNGELIPYKVHCTVQFSSNIGKKKSYYGNNN